MVWSEERFQSLLATKEAWTKALNQAIDIYVEKTIQFLDDHITSDIDPDNRIGFKTNEEAIAWLKESPTLVKFRELEKGLASDMAEIVSDLKDGTERLTDAMIMQPPPT